MKETGNNGINVEVNNGSGHKGLQQFIKLNMSRSDLVVYIILALLFVLVITNFSPFYQRFVIEMMIFAILALSMDFLLGYGGLLNLAHSLFFGINIYVITILFVDYQLPFLVAVLLALVITLAIAFFIGFFSCRLQGIQFAMVTLAFGELFFILVTKMRDITGGTDGRRFPNTIEITIGNQAINLTTMLPLLIIVNIMLFATYYIIRKIVQSPFGSALTAVHENEERAKFLGFNVFRIKLQSFLISAFFSALAGVGYLLLKTFVSPNYISWAFSGDVLLMTLIGGMGTLVGPLFGAMGFIWFKDWLSSFTEHWMLVVGLLFMLVVVFFPRGLFGWVQRNK
jgi:branched-chain amino acid transport system permease protein